MLRSTNLFPCGQTRREFVWQMGGGFAGLALASLLTEDGFFARHVRAATPSPAGPLAPRKPHFATKARSVIFLLMNERGGPISGQPNWSSGFLSAAYAGTLFRPTGDPILDLRGPAHMDTKAQLEQLDLLAKLNQEHIDARPGGRELAARINSYEL